MWIRLMFLLTMLVQCGCQSWQSPPTVATSKTPAALTVKTTAAPTVKKPTVVHLSDKDCADYSKHVGERVEVVGVVSKDTKCPYVCGIDVWNLDAYRGRRVKLRGTLHETIVTQESIDQMRRSGPVVANRGAGRFYSLDEMEFEVLPYEGR